MRHRYQMLLVLPLVLGLGVVGCKKKPKGDDPKRPEAVAAGMDKAIASEMDTARERPGRATPPAREAATEAARKAPSDKPREAPREAPRGITEGDAPKLGGSALGGTVTFKKVLPKPGLTRTAIENTNMHFTITMKGQTIKVSNTGVENKTEKLLAARGSSPTKLEVTYHKVVKVEVLNGKTRNKPTLIEGKTYVVEAKDGKVTVTTPDGKPVPVEEARLVAKDHKSLGKPNFMLDALPTTPIQMGARVPAMEQAMKKSFMESMGGGGKEQWTIASPTVTLSSKGQVDGADVARLTFALAMTMTRPGGFTMTMRMKGTVTIRLADGWPLRMTMAGPMDIMGQTAAGQMNMSQVYRYQ